ncbi:response regulator [Pseudomonas sp. NPDC007930]|uniref:response regulator n=1 Tax=Pseudomonas sp. NPDC007930 TaxID=3364417 RepID=UPI0036F04994
MQTAFIADDHPFIRTVVRRTLERADISVVGEAGDGISALKGVRRLEPDLLVLDLDMPGISGLQVLDRLLTLARQPKVLVLSAHLGEHYGPRCLRAGAMAYLCKRHGLEHLLLAVEALRCGFIFFAREASQMAPPRAEAAKHAEVLAGLSPRELQVLHYLALGVSNVGISGMLNISNKTVSSHKRRLLRKFEVRSVIDLAEILEANRHR